MANPAGDGPRFRSIDLFDCATLCRRFGSRELDPEARAAACCALPDFDTSAWTATNVQAEHLGAEPDYEAEATDPRWQHPVEPIEDQGCPSSFARSAFVRSLAKYRRPMDANGSRISHHAYDACTDPFVQECLRIWEAEEMAAESYRLRVIQGQG